MADEDRGVEEGGQAEGVVGGAGPSGPEACSLRAVTTAGCGRAWECRRDNGGGAGT